MPAGRGRYDHGFGKTANIAQFLYSFSRWRVVVGKILGCRGATDSKAGDFPGALEGVCHDTIADLQGMAGKITGTKIRRGQTDERLRYGVRQIPVGRQQHGKALMVYRHKRVTRQGDCVGERPPKVW